MTDHWFHKACPNVDKAQLEHARQHQLSLTKPPGSLGLLEDIAIAFCGWQNSLTPSLNEIQISIFAGDHGVCQQGVSAFPQEVTAQMIHNFVAGGAAISVLARELKADFRVVNMGIVSQIDDAPNLINKPIRAGTHDFTVAPAMSKQELSAALLLGKQQISKPSNQLFIGGDMGIGNTTSASAIYSMVLDLPPERTAGPGTGLDSDGIKLKRKVLYQALNQHAEHIESELDILQRVGGLEIAGLVGAYIASAQNGTPLLIDGFISTAAALLAARINPSSRAWMMFAHKSAEPAHQHALAALDARPLLDMGMRLGEGSGAGVATSLIKSALALHNEMATFDSAGVSENQT